MKNDLYPIVSTGGDKITGPFPNGVKTIYLSAIVFDARPVVMNVDFDPAGADGWKQILPEGEYFIFTTGAMHTFTADYLNALKARFDTEGQHIPIDKEHELSKGLADSSLDVRVFGSITALEVRPGKGLYGKLAFNEIGKALLKECGYKYLSASIMPMVPHRITGEKSSFMFSVSLTHLPNISDIEPIIAAHATFINNQKPIKGVTQMRALILAWLMACGVQIKTDATDDAIMAALKTQHENLSVSIPPTLAGLLGHTGEKPMSIDQAAVAVNSFKDEIPATLAAMFTGENVTVASAVKEVATLSATAAAAPDLTALNAGLVTADKKVMTDAIDAAFGAGKGTPAEREKFERLYAADPELCLSTLKGLAASGPLSAVPKVDAAPAVGTTTDSDIEMAKMLGLTLEEMNGVEKTD